MLEEEKTEIRDILKVLRRRGGSLPDDELETLCDKLDSYRQRIESGETTGDDVIDFSIVHHYPTAEKMVPIYRRLLKKIEPGKEVLVVDQQKVRPSSYQGIPKEKLERLVTELTFGVPNSAPELDIKSGHLIIPADKHVNNLGLPGYNTDLRNGSIIISNFEVEFIDRKIEGVGTNQTCLSIHTGFGVRWYFFKNPHLKEFYMEARKIMKES